jgi:hypothetical protein
MGNHRFEIQGGAVCKVDASTEAVIARCAPEATEVVQVLPKGDHLIVREDYYRFPEARSNLYCLDHHLRRIWTAALPAVGDAYANPVIDRGAVIECGTWGGFTCEIDPVTGQIVREAFTK